MYFSTNVERMLFRLSLLECLQARFSRFSEKSESLNWDHHSHVIDIKSATVLASPYVEYHEWNQ